MFNIFLAYDNRDRVWADKLSNHLKPLERKGSVSFWYKELLNLGDKKREVIEDFLHKANIIITFLSPESIGSDNFYYKYIENPELNDKLKIGIIVRKFSLSGVPLRDYRVFPQDKTSLEEAMNSDARMTEVICLLESFFKKEGHFLEELEKEKTNLKTPKEQLESIENLYKWSELSEKYSETKKIFKLIVEYENKPDIYRGFLFPLFNLPEVKDVYYCCGSILWGSNFLGKTFLLEVICQLLGNKLVKNKEIKIFMNSIDIDYYYNKDRSYLKTGMEIWQKIFDDKVYLMSNQDISRSELYLKIKTTSNEEDYFKITLYNKVVELIGVFDGKIDVKRLNKRMYNSIIKALNNNIERAEKCKEKGVWDSNVKTFGMALNTYFS